MKKILAISLVAVFISSAAPPNTPAGRKLSADLANANPLSTVRVIIQWQTPPTQAFDQKVVGLLGSVVHHFNSINGGVYELPVSSLAPLANDSNVSFISPDRMMTAKLDNTAAAVNASAVWSAGLTGVGIGVAVIDSGINADPNLGAGKPPVFSYDFTQPAALSLASTLLAGITQPLPALTNLKFASQNAPDQFGHGQHVAGIIASNGKGSQCPQCSRLFKGIAPNVNLINLKVLDQNGAVIAR